MTITPQGPWLSIVGIGEDGWDGLRAEAKQAIESADLLFGGARHLAHVPETAGKAARSVWPSPMAPAVREILEQHRKQRRIVVLGSGDPMLYGVGVTLTRALDFGEFRVIPQVSAFSLACARLGWPAADTVLISLVNRPVEQVHRSLVSGQRLVLYSENGGTPAIVAQLLTESGYGGSRLHVFENLDGKNEQHRTELARAWPAGDCAPLNVVALICEADAGVIPLPLVPGLPDDAFETDGQLTKREVRAATLARLAPLPEQTLWDVGAGTGTVGIEWMRTHPSCRCVAFEARPDRAARILTNARRL
jgi:precorrin-6Y C5,15-methyltransferase (decarboxylating)